MLQLVWVTDAQYIGGYKIAVTFNDGKSKTVDLESHLTGQVLSPLKDLDLFRTFKVTGWTIEWANGSDIAPEFLYNC